MYVVLEMAMSLHRVTVIRDYWPPGRYSGSPHFPAVMSHTAPQSMRVLLRLYLKCNHGVAVAGPFWRPKHMMKYLLRSFIAYATPAGLVGFGKSTIYCNGGTAVRSYMKKMPVKFGDWLYLLLCWASEYLFFIHDNGSENRRSPDLALSCISNSEFCTELSLAKWTRTSFSRQVLGCSPCK